jgi:uncharacterized phage-associated protein
MGWVVCLIVQHANRGTNMRIQIPATPQPGPKLANTMLYLLERCGSPLPGKQALLKMVWYADYWHYMEHLSLITESEYVAMPNGPVLDNYQDLLDGLVKQGVLGVEEKPIYGKPNPKEEYRPLVQSDESQFSEIELRTLQRVLTECGGQTGGELSLRTHLDPPWLMAWDAQRPNQPIPRMLFRWAENLPDEEDYEFARQALARESVQRDLKTVAA